LVKTLLEFSTETRIQPMKLVRFKEVSEFSTALVNSIKENLGHISMRRMGYIAHRDMGDLLDSTVEALSFHFQLPVYIKDNISSTSQSITIAVFWSSLWIYLSFNKKKKNVKAVLMYRKNRMQGVHHLWKKIDD
jgi:hypothetical protein